MRSGGRILGISSCSLRAVDVSDACAMVMSGRRRVCVSIARSYDVLISE